MRALAAVAATGAAVAGAFLGATVATNEAPAPQAVTLSAGQYIGPCSVVTPPEPDPCEAAQGQLRYVMLGHLVNAVPYKNWRKGAPADAARLDALLANPQCPTPLNPQEQTMTTFFGAAIGAAMQAYACAKGVGPVSWPPPNPPPTPGSSDTKPPTAPGAPTITP